MMNGTRGGWLLGLIGALSLALTACAPSPTNFAPADPSAGNAARATQTAGGRRIAVSHTFSLRLPSSDIEAIQRKHLAECTKLGGTVLNTRLDQSNEGRIGARSLVRIAPDDEVTEPSRRHEGRRQKEDQCDCRVHRHPMEVCV
jgi:hypothetical protein